MATTGADAPLKSGKSNPLRQAEQAFVVPKQSLPTKHRDFELGLKHKQPQPQKQIPLRRPVIFSIINLAAGDVVMTSAMANNRRSDR